MSDRSVRFSSTAYTAHSTSPAAEVPPTNCKVCTPRAGGRRRPCWAVGGSVFAHGRAPSVDYRDVEAALAFLSEAFGMTISDVERDESGVIRAASAVSGAGRVLVQPDLPDELHGTHLGNGWVYSRLSREDPLARRRAPVSMVEVAELRPSLPHPAKRVILNKAV